MTNAKRLVYDLLEVNDVGRVWIPESGHDTNKLCRNMKLPKFNEPVKNRRTKIDSQI